MKPITELLTMSKEAQKHLLKKWERLGLHFPFQVTPQGARYADDRNVASRILYINHGAGTISCRVGEVFDLTPNNAAIVLRESHGRVEELAGGYQYRYSKEQAESDLRAWRVETAQDIRAKRDLEKASDPIKSPMSGLIKACIPDNPKAEAVEPMTLTIGPADLITTEPTHTMEIVKESTYGDAPRSVAAAFFSALDAKPGETIDERIWREIQEKREAKRKQKQERKAMLKASWETT